LDLNEPCTSKSYSRTIDSKSRKENTYILEKNGKDESKKTLPRHGHRVRSLARIDEIRIRREQAERIAQERLRSGSMTGGEINIDANTSSQIGSNRIRDDERRYQESLILPPILSDEDREILNISNTNNNLSPLEPRVNNNYNPLEPSVNNSQNNSQSYNNSSNNQGNTKNNCTNNSQYSNNSTSNSK